MRWMNHNKCSICEKKLEKIWIEVKGDIGQILCNDCFNEKENK